jgi:hypothetical protein
MRFVSDTVILQAYPGIVPFSLFFRKKATAISQLVMIDEHKTFAADEECNQFFNRKSSVAVPPIT